MYRDPEGSDIQVNQDSLNFDVFIMDVIPSKKEIEDFCALILGCLEHNLENNKTTNSKSMFAKEMFHRRPEENG